MWFKKENNLYPDFFINNKETFKEKIKYLKNRFLGFIQSFSSFSSIVILFVQKFHF